MGSSSVAQAYFQTLNEPNFSCEYEARIGMAPLWPPNGSHMHPPMNPVGRIADGGKWICNPPILQRLGKTVLIYSIGSS
jgi:hypothetical protein